VPLAEEEHEWESSGSDGSDRTLTYSDNDVLELFGFEGSDFSLRPNKLLRMFTRIAVARKVQTWLDMQL